MTWNWNGFGLAMICLLIIVAQYGLHKFTKKVTNTYWFWLGIGTFCFVWLLVFRFVPAWKDYIEQKGSLDGSLYSDANIISKAWLLDICPFMGLFMTFAVIIDPTRKIARAAAPLALIGGILIIFIQMPFEDAFSDTSPTWSIKWIMCGEGINRCYFFLHAVNLFFAIGVMINTPRYTWKGYLHVVIAAALYYSYVLIVSHKLGCKWFVSGTNLNDWTSQGEYTPVHDILHCSPKTAMIIGFPFCFAFCSGLIALKDYVFSRWIWKYGNAYSGRWWSWYDYKTFNPVGFFDNIKQVKIYKSL